MSEDSKLWIVNPGDPGDPKLRKELEDAVSGILEGADEVFEPEPDTRTEQEKMIDDALQDLPEELHGYLKAAAKIMIPGFGQSPGMGMTGIGYAPPKMEYRIEVLSLKDIHAAVVAQQVAQNLVNIGWLPRFDGMISHDGIFLVAFGREKPPENSGQDS